MDEREHVPYFVLVELGVLQRRLETLASGMAAVDVEIGRLLARWAGPFPSDFASDHFWDEWGTDVDRRLAAAEASDA